MSMMDESWTFMDEFHHSWIILQKKNVKIIDEKLSTYVNMTCLGWMDINLWIFMYTQVVGVYMTYPPCRCKCLILDT